MAKNTCAGQFPNFWICRVMVSRCIAVVVVVKVEKEVVAVVVVELSHATDLSLLTKVQVASQQKFNLCVGG